MHANPLPDSSTAESLVTAERPWLGLAAFNESCRDYFFGRDEEVEELTDRIRRSPLTLLYGVSGYGKSSLLGAGVVPALRDLGYAVVFLRRCYDDLAVRPLAGDLLSAVAAAVPGSLLPGEDAPNGLWEFFHDRAQPWLADQREENEENSGSSGGGRNGVVIILDQFEEIFIKGEDRVSGDPEADARARHHARDFLRQLAGLVENAPSGALAQRLESASLEEKRALLRRYDFRARPVHVAIALREDFLARIERLRRTMPSLMRQRVELRLLTGEQALRAVFEPGTKRPGKPPIIPQEVAELVVCAASGAAPGTDLRDIVAVPPILSLLCERLNARRLAMQPVVESVSASDFAPGEASRILGTFYHEKTASHPRALRDYLEDRLVSDSGLRETVTLDSAVAGLRAQGVSDAPARLHTLVDDRIVVIEERGGVQRLEFTHDTLAAHAHLRRAERVIRRRRRRALMAVTACLLVTLASLGLVLWLKAQLKHLDARSAELEAISDNLKAKTYTLARSNNFFQEIIRKVNDVSTWGSAISDQNAEAMNAAVCRFYVENPPAPDDLDSLVVQASALNRRGDLLAHNGQIYIDPPPPEDLNPTATQRFAEASLAYQQALAISRDVVRRGSANQFFQTWRLNLAATLERTGNAAYNEARRVAGRDPAGALRLVKSSIRDHREGAEIGRSFMDTAPLDPAEDKAYRELYLNHLGPVVFGLNFRADLQAGDPVAQRASLQEAVQTVEEMDRVYNYLIDGAEKPGHEEWKKSLDSLWKYWHGRYQEAGKKNRAGIELLDKGLRPEPVAI